MVAQEDVLQSDFDGDGAVECLPNGTRLCHGQYTIVRFLSSGGFGFTYLAKDSLNREVVIKECFPTSLCRRNNGRVTATRADKLSSFAALRDAFLSEARHLARLKHPNIVGVHHVFEDNDTAYMALDYIQGQDLLDTAEGQDAAFGPYEVVATARKLIRAVGFIHDAGLLHGDISPDNIFINLSGEPILIDFGATRTTTLESSETQIFSIVKDGYSPHEFYFHGGRSGPWSDLYALAASLYHVVVGAPPTAAQVRMARIAHGDGDPMLPLVGRFPDYPEPFLASLDKAMSPFPAQRFQTAHEWESCLHQHLDSEQTDMKLFRKAARKKPPEQTESSAHPESAVPETAQSTNASKGTNMAIDIAELTEISGFIGGCLVDSESGLMLASELVGQFDLEAAGAANTEVVRAKNKAIKMLGLNDHIDDILISLGAQLHLIRPLEKNPSMFLYVALDKKAANLGLARMQVKKVEKTLKL